MGRPNPSPSVLVVEDDPRVRQWLVGVLEHMGAQTLEAGDGEYALALLEAGVPVDFALVDWELPGLRGGPLLDRIADRHPDLPAIIATRRSLGVLELSRPNVLACLQKPFDPHTLVEVVQGAMRIAARQG